MEIHGFQHERRPSVTSTAPDNPGYFRSENAVRKLPFSCGAAGNGWQVPSRIAERTKQRCIATVTPREWHAPSIVGLEGITHPSCSIHRARAARGGSRGVTRVHDGPGCVVRLLLARNQPRPRGPRRGAWGRRDYGSGQWASAATPGRSVPAPFCESAPGLSWSGFRGRWRRRGWPAASYRRGCSSSSWRLGPRLALGRSWAGRSR